MEFFRNRGFQARDNGFVQDYRCFSVAAKNRADLERGDKILLPESALRALTRQRVAYPMLFRLLHREANRITHCSVMEFSAEEGVCYMPLWMMEQLGLYDGALVNVKNVSLKKATFVKIQPHKTAFTEISNPKAVLEHKLRNFSCLTTGDTLSIEYNGERFLIDVLEVKPDGKACIIETDCEVDFAQPLDYKEPKKVFPPKKKVAKEPEVSTADTATATANTKDKTKSNEEETKAESPHFKTGGYRLDGKKHKTTPTKPKAKPKPKAQIEKEVRLPCLNCKCGFIINGLFLYVCNYFVVCILHQRKKGGRESSMATAF